jgi:hypothetical protein
VKKYRSSAPPIRLKPMKRLSRPPRDAGKSQTIINILISIKKK